MTISIGVIGNGFVGGSLTTVFAERGFDVYTNDISGRRAPGGKAAVQESYKPTSTTEFVTACERFIKPFSNVFFVCVPTPMSEDGSADLSIVEGILDEMANIPGKRIAVIKSTVPPGSTHRWNEKYKTTGLRVIFSPEFLTEKNALDDMRNQNRIIIGGPRPHVDTVKRIFQSAFPKVPIVKTSSTNAELTKYVTNCFLAMKVSFANEIYQTCNALDAEGLNADYDRVIECATLDERLGKSHWQVPSFETDEHGKPLAGWSLSCFPKDLNALIYLERYLGVEPTMLEATWKKNVEVRPGRDWQKLIGRAVSKKVNK